MMEQRIMDALGHVKEAYIEEAAPEGRRRKKANFRWVAAAAVIGFMLLFLQTAPGAAAVEIVREQVTRLIEELFPPKDTVLEIEGFEESVHYEAFIHEPETQETGEPSAPEAETPATEEETPEPETQEPEVETSAPETQGWEMKDVPGFVMYVDTEEYYTAEENGVFYVRPIPISVSREEVRKNNSALFEGLSEEEAEAEIDRILAEKEAFYASLPVCEMEIVHLPDILPAAAAEAARAELLGSWENVREIEECPEPKGLRIHASKGLSWDSACVDIYFIEDHRQGTFQVTIRYFMEATEGHATRCKDMLRTFEVLEP